MTNTASGAPHPALRATLSPRGGERGLVGDVINAVLESGNRVRFTAVGDSMHPFIRSGQQVVVEPVEARALRRGDVVLAQLDRGLTAHRIVRIERCGGDVVRITTRGDNCELEDPPFSPDQLVGRIRASRLGIVLGVIARVRRFV